MLSLRMEWDRRPAVAAGRNRAKALARLGNTHIGPGRPSDSRSRDRWPYWSSSPLLAQSSCRLPNPRSQAGRSLQAPSVLEDVPVPGLINPTVSPWVPNEDDLTVIGVRAALPGGAVDRGHRDGAPRARTIPETALSTCRRGFVGNARHERPPRHRLGSRSVRARVPADSAVEYERQVPQRCG
jgi:hypothetical protein